MEQLFIYGSVTTAYEWLCQKLSVQIDCEVWEKFGPLFCRLSADEGDLVQVWEEISGEMEEEVGTIKDAIKKAKELYIILDHTRTLLMVIQDDSLPSNQGDGGNVRTILRRVFDILRKNRWWEKLGVDGLLELCDMHKKGLEAIYGSFSEYKSFKNIIKIEYNQWFLYRS